MKKTFSKTSILDTSQLLTFTSSEVSETAIKNYFRKIGIFEKLVEETINDQDDLFKDLEVEEFEETNNEFLERLSGEVPEELNAAVLLDIGAKLSTHGDRANDVEILGEVQREAIQEEEDDINIVYDKPSKPPSSIRDRKSH